MISWMRRINLILPEMIGILFLYSLLVEIIGVLIVDEKIYHSLGVLVGFILGSFMLINMAIGITDMLSAVEKNGKAGLIIKAIVRYIIVAAVIVSMVYFKWGNFISCFITIFGVKIAAYLQPFLHNRFKKKDPKEVSE